jgi:hypothetical protein
MVYNFDAKKIEGINQYLQKNLKISKEEQIYNPFEGYELESKFSADINLLEFYKNFLKIKNIRPYKAVRRTEIHYVYKSSKKIYVLIYAYYGNSELWLKEKNSNSKIILLNKKDMPILLRRETMNSPANKNHIDKIDKVKEICSYIGKFRKESLDLYFWYQGYHFSLTFALAKSGKNKFEQFEIEFDGIRSRKVISKKKIFKSFAEVIQKVFPDYSKRITIERKVDWLENLNSKERDLKS